mmetsp:Transcript_7892/g.11868  ORF Transcript_7892/g.11868 Transcript_7892/m.11868 type:complete len:455 (+) Transcript_7892:140-1504(+)
MRTRETEKRHLLFVLVENERAIRSAESETVGHGSGERAIVPLRQNVHALGLVHELLDICRLGHEIIVHHENSVNGLVHARGSERVPRQTLRRSDVGVVSLLFEQPLDGPQLGEVAHRRRRTVRIDVFHRLLPVVPVRLVHGELHAPLPPHAAGRDHVVPVRVGAVPDELGVDLRAAGLGVLELLQDDDSPSSGDAESVAVLVEGPGGLLGIVVVGRGERAHAVEHAREVPVDVLAGPAEGHVGLVQEDLLVAGADAMGAGTAGGGNGEAHPLDLECRGEDGRDGGSHRPRDAEGSHLVLPTSAILHGRDGIDDVGDGRSPLSEDGADAWILLVILGGHAGVLHGALHGDVRVLGVGPHEAEVGLGDELLEVCLGHVGSAADVRFDAEVGPFLIEFDADLAVVEGFLDVREGVSEAGRDSHAGDYHASVGEEGCGGDRRPRSSRDWGKRRCQSGT